MTYTSLSVLHRGYLLSISTVIMIMYIYILVRMAYQHRKKSDIVPPALMASVSFVLLQIMTMIQQGDVTLNFGIPVVLIISVQAVLLIYGIRMLRSIAAWQRAHISPMSVKEAFDKLPAGLAFYTRSGIPIMVNESMQSISRELYGQSVRDAAALWERLKEDCTDDTAGDDLAIVRDSRGNILSVTRREITIRGNDILGLRAADISREYELTRELETGRDRARVVNTRLKALIGTIEYVSMNRELLQLKRALHDNIGQSMLIARRYLYAPDSVDRRQMLDIWRGNISHLINDEPEKWELPYYVISREADIMGIRLDVTGSLPEEKELIPIVDAAISTQLGNTLKHADGTVVTIEVTEDNEGYKIVFGNDGRAPEGEIIERGGLQSLRREVEQAGGHMRITSQPRFEMILELPKEDGHVI